MTLELKAQKREALGKTALKGIREKGLIPAELYGNGIENAHLSLNKDEFSIVYKKGGENTIVNVDFGEDPRPVLIHDVHIDPVSLSVLAVDLYQVNLKEKITTSIPIEFVGESPAVENLGGTLIKTLEEIEIEALPMNIPQQVEIDISTLDDFHKSIHVSDLKAGADFEIKTDLETVIASVAEPREEEEEGVDEMSVDDVEVEGEKKDSEETSDEEGENTEKEEEKSEGDN